MAVFRKETQQYTVIPQAVIRDERLSLKDMGLLLRLLSFPDNWEFSENGLVAVFAHDGQAAVRSSLKRLEDFGYLVRKRCRDELGKLTNCEWTIYDTPNCDFPNLDNPNLEKPNLDNPRLENRPQSNTKESNTKEFNTKESNTKGIDIYSQVIEYLNQKTGKKYRDTTPATRRMISARLAEGNKLDDFKRVIDTKVKAWKNDKRMKQYLRPETLFAASHFESYLNEGGETNGTAWQDSQPTEYGVGWNKIL